MSLTIGSTPFEDLERGIRFADDELLLTTEEMPSMNISSYVERDLIDDAFNGDDDES